MEKNKLTKKTKNKKTKINWHHLMHICNAKNEGEHVVVYIHAEAFQMSPLLVLIRYSFSIPLFHILHFLTLSFTLLPHS